MIELNNSNYDSAVSDQQILLVEFGAEWCGPCKMILPVLQKLSSQRQDVKVCKVDIDESPELASRHQIRSVPTLILYKNGVEIKRHVGLTSYEKLITIIDG